MKSFARLFAELDQSTATRAKQAALVRYFETVASRATDDEASERDAAWAVYFLAGGKPRQTVPMRVLRQTARDLAGLPEWLFDECYQAVGDLAETIAHVLPPPSRTSDLGLATWVEDRLLELKGSPPDAIARCLAAWWDELDTAERFLLTKLIGGGFRVGVSKLSVTRALATVAGLDPKIVAHRLMGYTDGRSRPGAAAYRSLLSQPSDEPAGERPAELLGQPYPFFLAHALNEPVTRFDALLGSPDDWQVEWKYDGIRGQLVVRGGAAYLWSRGEELVTERFPELAALVDHVPPGTVIDGEILVWRGGEGAGAPAPFADLQTRIGRKSLSKKLLADTPVVLVAYDLLEEHDEDLRDRPQAERRARLAALVAAVDRPVLRLSPVLRADSWQAYATLREEARARRVEGFMLKRRDARYGTGRTKDVGVWWKWKIDPLTIDAVLVYAQRGHGRRASLYTDFTFAVWDRALDPNEEGSDRIKSRTLIPFAKAYSGLTDDEMVKVDAIVRKTTIEKFGPVRSVEPTQVFELGFEGIQRSSRHKSGIATRFPRMLRWRTDKPVAEADTLASLEALMADGDASVRDRVPTVDAAPVQLPQEVADDDGQRRHGR